MVLTKLQRKEVIKHVLEENFLQEPDSELHKTLIYNKITSPIDLITQTDDWIDKLQFYEDPKDKKTLSQIPKGDAGLLKSFKAFIMWHAATGNPIEDGDWKQITLD